MSAKFTKNRAGRAEFVKPVILYEIRDWPSALGLDQLNDRAIFWSAAALATAPDPAVRSFITNKYRSSSTQVAEAGCMIVRMKRGNGKLAAKLSEFRRRAHGRA